MKEKICTIDFNGHGGRPEIVIFVACVPATREKKDICIKVEQASREKQKEKTKSSIKGG